MEMAQEGWKASDHCNSIPSCGSPPHALTTVTRRTADWSWTAEWVKGFRPFARTDTGVECGPVEWDVGASNINLSELSSDVGAMQAQIVWHGGMRERRLSSHFWRW